MMATDSDNLQAMTDSITVWLQVRQTAVTQTVRASGNQIVAAWE